MATVSSGVRRKFSWGGVHLVAYGGHLYLYVFHDTHTVYTRFFATLFLPRIWSVFCVGLIRATYPEGQSFRMSYHRISVIQSNRKCHLAMGE